MRITRKYELDRDQIIRAITQFVERELIDTQEVGYPIEEISDEDVVLKDDGVFEMPGSVVATVTVIWEVSDPE